MRSFTPGRGSELFWAAHRNRYRVEEWGIDGVLRRVLHREAPWFPDQRGTDDRGPDERPLPHIVDIQVDSDDRMWVLIRYGSERWDEIMGSRAAGVLVALWLNAPSGWLDGERPLHLLATEPDRVVRAARKTTEPLRF